MIEKQEIVVKEYKTSCAGFRAFNLSFGEIQLVVSSTFDLFAFNNSGYFTKLLSNFKEKDKACYLLFRALTWPEPGAGGAYINEIREALNLTNSYFTLSHIDPGESRLLKRLGEEIHFLMLKDDCLPKLQKILSCIDSKGTWCFFIFDTEANRDNLFAKIEKLFRANALSNERNLYGLCLDMIKFGSQGLWAEYELEVFTNRYEKPQIKDLLINSVDPDKFEVILK